MEAVKLINKSYCRMNNLYSKSNALNATQHATKLRWISVVPLASSLLCLMAALFYAYQWYQASQLNQSVTNKSILNRTLALNDYQAAYSVGYLRQKNHQQDLAIKAFTIAESSDDEEMRTRAKYALGNIYFDLSVKSANVAAGGAHQQAVAYIELAREYYKGALRLQPDLYDARYNLELLDRMSPEKRTQAWQAETDGVTLKPFKRNGTAMMRDNKRRGLP